MVGMLAAEDFQRDTQQRHVCSRILLSVLPVPHSASLGAQSAS